MSNSINNEYYFLSDCYEHNVDDTLVYQKFIEKVIIDNNKIGCYNVSHYQKDILENYKIEIPPTLINNIFKNLSKEYSELIYKKDCLDITKIPNKLEEKYNLIQLEADKQYRNIYDEFNDYLKINKFDIINYKTLIDLISNIKSQILHSNTKIKIINDYERLFNEWIKYVFTLSKNRSLLLSLNKIIYSYLLYYYFYSIKRANKKFNNKEIIFDTNLIIYLLEVDGFEIKNYVHYLIDKLKQNKCTIIISTITLKELSEVFKNEPNPDIIIFNNKNPALKTQIIHSSKQIAESLFNKYEIKYNIVTENLEKKSKTISYWNELYSSLNKYKSFNKNGKLISEISVDHDVNLICLTNEHQKVNNLYELKRICVTGDGIFVKWYNKYVLKEFNSIYSSVLSLEKLNLILWAENDKFNDSNFLPNTWLYISDSITYFNDSYVNNLFKTIKNETINDVVFSEGWRSLYLLIKNNLPDDITPENATIDHFNNALEIVKEVYKNENEKLISNISESQKELEFLNQKLSEKDKEVNNLRIEKIELTQQSQNIKLELIQHKEEIEIGKEFKKNPLIFILKWIFKYVKKIFSLFK
jgi:hypothetical protein